jgi:hypothetical protein
MLFIKRCLSEVYTLHRLAFCASKYRELSLQRDGPPIDFWLHGTNFESHDHLQPICLLFAAICKARLLHLESIFKLHCSKFERR